MQEPTVTDTDDDVEDDAGGELVWHTKRTPFTQVPDWLLTHPDLSDQALRTWLVIASFANKERTAFPGLTLVARKRGKSRRQVSRHLTELEQAGAILRKQRRRSDGGQTSNLYVLAWDYPLKGQTMPVQSLAPPSGLTGETRLTGDIPPLDIHDIPRTRTSVEPENPLTPTGENSGAVANDASGGRPPRTPAPFSSSQQRPNPRALGTNPRATAAEVAEAEHRGKRIERAHARGFDHSQLTSPPPYETVEEFKEMLIRETLRHHREIDPEVLEAELAGYAKGLDRVGVA